jgi:ribose 5-phosphate isomerase B
LRIAVASDHAGFELKTRVVEHLRRLDHDVVDFGTDSTLSVDYPIYCARVGRAVAGHEVELGMVLGGSGQGEQISANKVRGVRAALCHNELTARLARAHNDANVLALGERVLGVELALAIVDAFLAAGFEGGRHARRVEQIAEIEEEEARR